MKIEISKDEARTVLWALSVVRAKECKRLLKKGISPSEHRTVKNLDNASRIINSAVIDADWEEVSINLQQS